MATRTTPTMAPWNPMSHEDYDLLRGVEVTTRDGQHVGKIKEIYHPSQDVSLGRATHFFLFSPGHFKEWFRGLEEVYIPESAIAGTTDDGVMLTLTKDELKHHAWDVPDGSDADRLT